MLLHKATKNRRSRSSADEYYADLNKAAFLSLALLPQSNESKCLGAELLAALLPKRGATRGRPINTENRLALVLAVVGDILLATKRARHRWVYRSLAPVRFKGAPYGYKLFRTTMEALVARGFLKITKGHFNRFMFGTKLTEGFGKARRWQATNKFFALCQRYGLTPENVGSHFISPLPKHPLVLKGSKWRWKQHKFGGRAINFTKTRRSQEIEAVIKELNVRLSQHRLDSAGFYGFRRIFNQGDCIEDYQWNKGGRLYCVGEDNYQNVKRGLRQHITIDDEPCVELDISASHLTVFHAILRKTFDPNVDPYNVDGLLEAPIKTAKEVLRFVAKTWVLIALGAGDFPDRWSREAGEDYRELTGRKSLGKDFPIKKVGKAVLEKHPALKHLKKSGITWADLQYRESEVIVAAMLRLLREDGIPSFPVHDSLLIKARNAGLASYVLKNEYEKLIGIRPHLKIAASKSVRKAFPNLEFATVEI